MKWLQHGKVTFTTRLARRIFRKRYGDYLVLQKDHVECILFPGLSHDSELAHGTTCGTLQSVSIPSTCCEQKLCPVYGISAQKYQLREALQDPDRQEFCSFCGARELSLGQPGDTCA